MILGVRCRRPRRIGPPLGRMMEASPRVEVEVDDKW